MTLAGHIGHHDGRLALTQRLWMAARSFARSIASSLNAQVSYDLHMYEALGSLRHWAPGDVVCDVGANDGRTTFRLLRHLPKPKIYAFEPVEQTFQVLNDATAECDGVEAHKLGLGNEIGTRQMYINERSVLNSLYPDWGDSRDTEDVEITTLDHFAREKGIAAIHLLKIDTEGHDLEVLKGARTLLEEGRIEIIQIEAGFAPPGGRQISLRKIEDYLRESGYLLYGIYNQCRNLLAAAAYDGSSAARAAPVLFFCDALFVKAMAGDAGALPGKAVSRPFRGV